MTKKIKVIKGVDPANDEADFRKWLESNHKRFVNLKSAVSSIIANLVTENGIDVLAIDGRAKDVESAVEKVKRKGYIDPKAQMTDITGVRIIVYFETDVARVCEIIRSAFRVDDANSSNTDERMSADQVGYRSMHFVCDLGDDRTKLPEFHALEGLKFELQVRTVLQHAWAELAHDRNYKLAGSLPRHLERRLFLLAGLLETADQGFDDLSKSLDEYLASVKEDSAKGDLDIEINSISLQSFLEQWCDENNIELQPSIAKGAVPADLVRELKEYGVTTLAQLKEIIPENYSAGISENSSPRTMYGVARQWMIIHDPERLAKDVRYSWRLGDTSKSAIHDFFPKERAEEIIQLVDRNKSRNDKE